MNKFIDLCCGIGGFTLALQKEGLKCVFACDHDIFAKQAYKANFDIWPQDDIFDIDPNDIPDHDILCSGFPCQPFSSAGRKTGLDNHSVFSRIMDIVEEKRPTAMILENVPYMMHINDGRDFGYMLDAIEDAGYYWQSSILNCGEYGIPQQRKRVYIIAGRKDHIEAWRYEMPRPTYEPAFLNSILLSDFLTTPEVKINGTDRVVWREECIVPSERNETILLGSYNGIYAQNNNIYSPNGQAITIKASAGHESGLYYINGRVRRLHTIEMKRAMGFPDNHITSYGNRGKQQLGNAVVPKMVQLIYRQMRDLIST